ncbi:arabinose metabolism transcriptional repressor [Ruminiclostridium hungatei]|uniref:Arabinose metabolism transcriptional repressor n=1 Tax=Ruminiclostridium hungatei TaxID=48256 RepID=A0A1V4SQ69_RUMHU|nr:GntR family transcriptional regulator [Ruminiclostridium hungatei]OPX45923.1 arabinose metabolism transcriptional repressor [Ruminiclostridium hungatei]
MVQKDAGQNKYSKLKDFIKEEIIMGRIKPGERISSENTLAERLSLSRHTVRKAISMLVNEGYLYTEHGRGTFCKDRSKSRTNSRNIGVMTTYISEYIFPGVIQGIDFVLSERGYSIMLKNTDNNVDKEAQYLQEILNKDLEGLIIEPTKSSVFTDNIAFYRALDEHNIPYLFIHGVYPLLSDKPHIVLDDKYGMYLAVKHLIDLGHKEITGIFKADDVQGIERHKGYVRALEESKMPYDPDSVIWFHTEDRKIKPQAEVEAMLKEGKKIDAIACYNDQAAFGVYEKLSEMGISVPEDISITGFDDSYYATSCPVKLTSVSHPKELLGELAARTLLEMLEKPYYAKSGIRQIIKPELIIRDSSIKRK